MGDYMDGYCFESPPNPEQQFPIFMDKGKLYEIKWNDGTINRWWCVDQYNQSVVLVNCDTNERIAEYTSSMIYAKEV
jgi:hypothetical protein